MTRKLRTLLWFLIFLGGVTASILYVQGFRFQSDSGTLVPTGVLELSTVPPGALIFANDAFHGTTPQTLRGQNLGKTVIRFEKSGFQPLQVELSVLPDFVTYVRRIFLLPAEPTPVVFGSEHEILWDPERRGYIRILPEQKALQIFDFLAGSARVQEFPKSFLDLSFDADGDLQIHFEDRTTARQDVFSERFFSSWENIKIERTFSPEQDRLLSVQGNDIYMKEIDTAKTRLVFRAPTPIIDVWWMEGSEEVLITARSQVIFWNAELGISRSFTVPENIEEAFYIPEGEVLVYKSKETWFGIYFGLDKPFPQGQEIT